MNKYVQVDQYVLEKLLDEFKDAELSLMYECSTNFDKDRLKIQAEIWGYRASLGLPPDPNPITND